jgi:hypothetical protein
MQEKSQTTAIELRASITRRGETHRPIVEEYRRLTRAIGHPENQQLETEDSEEIIEAPSRIQV